MCITYPKAGWGSCSRLMPWNLHTIQCKHPKWTQFPSLHRLSDMHWNAHPKMVMMTCCFWPACLMPLTAWSPAAVWPVREDERKRYIQSSAAILLLTLCHRCDRCAGESCAPHQKESTRQRFWIWAHWNPNCSCKVSMETCAHRCASSPHYKWPWLEVRAHSAKWNLLKTICAARWARKGSMDSPSSPRRGNWSKDWTSRTLSETCSKNSQACIWT